MHSLTCSILKNRPLMFVNSKCDINGEKTFIIIMCDKVFKEIDIPFIDMKTEDNDQNEDTGETERLNLDIKVDTNSEKEVYYNIPSKSRRGRRKKIINTEAQTQSSLLKLTYSTTAELKFGPKYRPIRPKPYQPNSIARNKMFGMPSSVNVPAISTPGRFIVTTPVPCKGKMRESILDNADTKTNNHVNSTNENIGSMVSQIKEDSNDKSLIRNSTNTTIKNDLRVLKTPTKDNKGSIELFFESMAQTVISLPMHVQAEIKMEICKLVTMAEIKYSSLQSKQSYKND